MHRLQDFRLNALNCFISFFQIFSQSRFFNERGQAPCGAIGTANTRLPPIRRYWHSQYAPCFLESASNGGKKHEYSKCVKTSQGKAEPQKDFAYSKVISLNLDAISSCKLKAPRICGFWGTRQERYHRPQAGDAY